MSVLTAIDHEELMEQKPTLYESITNQLGQKVDLYEDPEEGDCAPVIAVIDGVAVTTDFWDTESFYEDSEYNPVLIDGEIMCFFQCSQEI